MRRRTNPLVTLGALIAVVVAAWLSGGFNRKAEPPAVDARPAQTRPPEARRPDTRPPETRTAETRTAETRASRPGGDAQLEATLALIERGGPFPYRQDGSTFGNRERRLPIKAHGYYREYTVPTPGAQNRGARRVVRGQNGETWYTEDHYRTFVRLD